MNGSTRSTVFVGLFVALAGVIFAAAILAVGTLQNTFSPKITAHAVFDEVGGLQSGDNVWSAGVRVGTVQRLAFLGPAKVDVTMRLNTALIEFIPADALATIGSDGLIGNPIVVLSGGTAGGPSVAEGGEFAIGESTSTADIMATLQKNNENLVAITADVKELTAGLKAGDGVLGKLLSKDSEDEIYGEVQAALSDIKEASADAKQLMASLSRFSAQLEKPGQLPYELVRDEELMPSVRAAVAELEKTAASASQLAQSLSEDMSDPGTPVGVLLSDRESGSDLKETLANLEQTTILLNEDLIAIRSNFLFRPYFKKQEREAKKEARRKEREGE